MFNETELRNIRKLYKAVQYVRHLTHEEELILLKITKLISEIHFRKDRQTLVEKTRVWDNETKKTKEDI
jgi:uncharacterized protein YbcV (DUF1398 family)